MPVAVASPSVAGRPGPPQPAPARPSPPPRLGPSWPAPARLGVEPSCPGVGRTALVGARRAGVCGAGARRGVCTGVCRAGWWSGVLPVVGAGVVVAGCGRAWWEEWQCRGEVGRRAWVGGAGGLWVRAPWRAEGAVRFWGRWCGVLTSRRKRRCGWIPIGGRRSWRASAARVRRRPRKAPRPPSRLAGRPRPGQRRATTVSKRDESCLWRADRVRGFRPPARQSGCRSRAPTLGEAPSSARALAHLIGTNSGRVRAECAGRPSVDGMALRLRSMSLRCSRARAVVGKSVASPSPTWSWFAVTNSRVWCS